MKTTIDQNGVLTVSAESHIEAYALKNWSESYVFTEKISEDNSILVINYSFNEFPKTKKEKKGKNNVK